MALTYNRSNMTYKGYCLYIDFKCGIVHTPPASYQGETISCNVLFFFFFFFVYVPEAASSATYKACCTL